MIYHAKLLLFVILFFGLIAQTIAGPGDYDGDGKFDAAIFRPSTGMWWVSRSTSGYTNTPFGENGDMPVPSAFVP
jgi:succinate-acetate transporter protein